MSTLRVSQDLADAADQVRTSITVDVFRITQPIGEWMVVRRHFDATRSPFWTIFNDFDDALHQVSR